MSETWRQFVVLEHDTGQGVHWDLMVESGEMLATWQLFLAPLKQQSQIDARRIFDHRLAYLEYEGSISHGRGNAVQWDRGRCQIIDCDALQWIINFDGRRIHGRYTLQRELDHAAWVLKQQRG